MSAVALTFRQFEFENKAFWRNPAAAFFTFVFPLMFLFIFNSVFGNDDLGRAGGRRVEFYVPAIATFSGNNRVLHEHRDERILRETKGCSSA